MRGEIVTMIVLCRIKCGKWHKLGYDRIAQLVRIIYRFDKILRRFFLLRRRVKNRGTVLGAYVIPLSVDRGRVVAAEKDSQ